MSPREAENITKDIYGIAATAARLPGEYDSNFHIKAADHAEYILKISRPSEMEAVIEMQNSALLWLAKKKRAFAFPQLQPNLKHQYITRVAMSDEQVNYVRLFSYVPGKMLVEVASQRDLLIENLGTQLGQLSVALQHFDHPAAKRQLKWDLMQAGWIQDHLQAIANEADRNNISLFVEHFIKETLPLLATMRQSVIHNDINDYNTLVSPAFTDGYFVSGFIDFGDMVKTATICELAIAMTYAILDHRDPLEAAAEIVQGYHAIFPLHEDEVSILFNLIKMRLCVSVVNSALRKKENPDDAYLTVSEKPAWQLLRKLFTIDASQATLILKKGTEFVDG